MHFPEFALTLGGHRCLGRRHRIFVERKRIVHKRHTDIIGIVFEDLINGGFHSTAERAFVIAELDNRHLRIDVATKRKQTDIERNRKRGIHRRSLFRGQGRRHGSCIYCSSLGRLLAPHKTKQRHAGHHHEHAIRVRHLNHFPFFS